MIVVDASVVIDVLLRTAAASRIEEQLRAHASLHCPHLLDVEVVQVLRRYVRSSQIDATRGAEAVADLGDLPILRHGHGALLRRAWELRENITAYDGMYVALAEALGVPLLTRDARLAAAPGSIIPIRVV